MLYERTRPGEFSLTDSGPRSYRERTVSAAAYLKVGVVLAMAAAGAQSVVKTDVPGAGKGALAIGATPAHAMAGAWKVVFIEPAANAGTFEVVRPDGTVDGAGNVGAPYAGGIAFTIADGATDFVAGDIATVTVTYEAGSGVMQPLTAAGVLARTERAGGVLWQAVEAAGVNATVRRNVLVTDAEIVGNGGRVRTPKGADDAETALIRSIVIEDLAALGIVVL